MIGNRCKTSNPKNKKGGPGISPDPPGNALRSSYWISIPFTFGVLTTGVNVITIWPLVTVTGKV